MEPQNANKRRKVEKNEKDEMSFQEIIETFSNKIKTFVRKGKLLDVITMR